MEPSPAPRAGRLGLLLLLLAGGGCQPDSGSTEPSGAKVESSRLVRGRHRRGRPRLRPRRRAPRAPTSCRRSVGSGAALFDFDGDGRLDIYLLQNGGPDSASTQPAVPPAAGRHASQDVSKGSGLDFAGYNMGVAVGDVNNDGRPDVLVTQYGGVKLFLNNGDGTFTDVTEEAGLDNPAWGTSAALLRLRPRRPARPRRRQLRRLRPDLRRAHDRAASATTARPTPFPARSTQAVPQPRPIAASGAAAVRFEDVTATSGSASRPGRAWASSAPTSTATAGPTSSSPTTASPTTCGSTRRTARSRRRRCGRGVAYNGMGQAQAGMGIALGDVDGDGLFDLFVTHLAEETNTPLEAGAARPVPRPDGRGRPGRARVARHRLRHRAGRLRPRRRPRPGRRQRPRPPRISPGRRADAEPPFWREYAERNQLFANDGAADFRDVSPGNPALLRARPAWPAAWPVATWTIDGALDLLVTERRRPGPAVPQRRPEIAATGCWCAPSTRRWAAATPTAPR